jgi:hypothetical protein
VIAALLAPDRLKDEETFQTDILAILFPAGSIHYPISRS